MKTRIAVAAKIRPGSRVKLEQMLAEGPPFDLADAGFESHQIYVGDDDVFFVFEGGSPITSVKRLAAERSLMGHLLRMASVVSSPHLLSQAFAWEGGSSRPSAG